MTLLLFAVMAYPMTGEALHKWIGISLFLLFLVHHILNLKWYQSMSRGKYTAVRWIHLVINVLLLVSMIGLMVSGFLLSSLAYDLHIRVGLLARKLHMFSASWGYILMSAHIGLHYGMLAGMIKKRVKFNIPYFVSFLFTIVIVAYGFYEAVTRQFFLKMFWMLDYAFYDFSEPVALFFIDYLFILCSFGLISHYLAKAPWKHISKRR